MADVRLTATNPEDSSVVPVACNAKGELKLEEPIIVEGPPGEQGEPGEKGEDGDPFSGNFAGDVTFGGSATIAGPASINTLFVGLGGGSVSTNTAVGNDALKVNTTGNFNTAVGREALEKNIEGSQNTAVGHGALYNNTTGDYNTAHGLNALFTNTTGDYNTAHGLNSLFTNTEGNYNTAHGQFALFNNTIGNQNTAVGQTAFYNNIEGSQNTAVGIAALVNNTEGNKNTAVGTNSGFYIEGDNNTILGAYQGTGADATLNDTVIISAGETERIRIDEDGISTFSGDVIVSSRNKKWMLVEMNGLCHMVEQLTATTADLESTAVEYPQLRDVFNELDFIEKALEEVMEKLRITPPSGWPVWDGSDDEQEPNRT